MPANTFSIRVLDADGAQANVTIVAGATGKKIRVTRATATADGSNTGPVNVALGFAISSLPTPTAASYATGLVLDFLGVPAGGGVTVGDGTGILGIGKDGESLRYSCEDPAGGAITIGGTYEEVAN